MHAPTMKDVKDYFSADTTRPVSSSEFSAFWKSIDDSDKDYYKTESAKLLGRV